MNEQQNNLNLFSYKRVMEDFKQKVKNFGYNGRPIINGKYSKPYKKFVLSNRKAPLLDGDIVFNNKIIKKDRLIDKRFKTFKIKNKFKDLLGKKIQILLRPKFTNTRYKTNDRFKTKDYRIFVSNVYDFIDDDEFYRYFFDNFRYFFRRLCRLVIKLKDYYDEEGTLILGKTISIPFRDYGGMSKEEFLIVIKLDLEAYNEEHYGYEPLNIEYIDLQTNKIFNGGNGVKLPLWLKSKNALFAILNNDNCCGQRCLAVSLQTPSNIKNLRKKTRIKQLDRLSKEMCDKLKIYGRMTPNDFDIFCEKFKRKVIVLTGKETIINECDKREDINDDSKIVYIYYDMTIEHYHLITNINSFVSNGNSQRYKWCNNCRKALVASSFDKHLCSGISCKCCKSLTPHTTPKNWLNCDYCNRFCYNEECLKIHIEKNHTYKKVNSKKGVKVGDKKDGKDWKCEKCRFVMPKSRYENKEHICFEFKCNNCEIYTTDKEHRCNVRKGKITKNNTGDEETYIGFDFESEFNEKGIHIVNYINSKELYTENAKSQNTLDEFLEYIQSVGKNTTFVAHNLKGYDGWIIHNHLKNTLGKKPSQIVLAGAKIMYMEFKEWGIRFIDSLNFIPMALDAMPKTFGLDESKFKKGFFPYLMNDKKYMNNDDKTNYIGDFPPYDIFEPNKMKASKNCNNNCSKKCKYCEFNKWYEENEYMDNLPFAPKRQYNFRKELEGYCISDVNILVKSLEIFRDSMREMNEGIDPLKCITIASYCMKVYLTLHSPTENELDELNYEEIEEVEEENLEEAPQTGLAILKKKEYDDMKKGFRGGRTEVFKLYQKWTEEDILSGKYGRYIDICSLYPSVQFLDYLPYGKPKLFEFNEDDETPDINNYFGYVECDITPPKNLLVPLLGGVQNNKFCFGLERMERATIPTPELQKALTLGYKIDRVYKIYHFKKTKELFKSYIRKFIKNKIEGGGFDGTEEEKEEYCREYKEKFNIEIDPNNLISNAGKKAVAKLCLNNLWGRFGMRQMNKNEYINTPEDWYKLLNRQKNKEVEILSREDLGNSLFVCYKELKEEKTSLNKTNVALCGMITSNARLRLYEVIGKLGGRLIYCDTDSCIYEYDKTKWNPEEGHLLGEWETEEKLPIKEIVAPAPKTYAYLTTDDMTEIKSKGIQLNKRNLKTINLEQYKKLVDGKVENLKTDNLVFKKTNEGMKTLNDIKLMKFEKDKFKRIINADYSTYPFGYNPN